MNNRNVAGNVCFRFFFFTGVRDTLGIRSVQRFAYSHGWYKKIQFWKKCWKMLGKGMDVK